MASSTAKAKYSSQTQLILSESMAAIIGIDATERGVSKAEAARDFMAAGMRERGYEFERTDNDVREVV
jgi:hypothetical protein